MAKAKNGNGVWPALNEFPKHRDVIADIDFVVNWRDVREMTVLPLEAADLLAELFDYPYPTVTSKFSVMENKQLLKLESQRRTRTKSLANEYVPNNGKHRQPIGFEIFTIGGKRL